MSLSSHGMQCGRACTHLLAPATSSVAPMMRPNSVEREYAPWLASCMIETPISAFMAPSSAAHSKQACTKAQELSGTLKPQNSLPQAHHVALGEGKESAVPCQGQARQDARRFDKHGRVCARVQLRDKGLSAGRACMSVSLFESVPCGRGSTRRRASSACGRTGLPLGRLRTWWAVPRQEPAPGRLCSTSAACRCAASHAA